MPRLFQSNDAFLANLHAVLLEMAREAYVLYHVCCLANADVPQLRFPGGIFPVGAALSGTPTQGHHGGVRVRVAGPHERAWRLNKALMA